MKLFAPARFQLEMSSTAFNSPPDFWPHFVERYWKARPVVVKHFHAAPIATAAEVFRGLLTAGEQFRAGVRRASMKFHTQGSLRYDEVTEKHFPQAGDNSLDGYAERIGGDLCGRRFYVAVDRYQAVDAEVYLRVREFWRGLYEIEGMPPSSSTVVILFGNYEKTPFGLHRDDADNFTFVLSGRKRILAWPDEYFRGREGVLRSLDYEPFREDAVVLEGEPGDLIYWPAHYWHIAESVGGFPLTMSAGHFYPPSETSAKILKPLFPLIEKRLRDACGAALYPLDVNRLSADGSAVLEAQLSTALRDASRDAQLSQSLRVAWLNRLSSFGFESVPPPLPPHALADDDVCRVNPHYPVLWIQADDKLVCSANGHAFSITAHPNVPKLLERLNSGAPSSVEWLVDKYAGIGMVNDAALTARPEDLRAILEKLRSLRALTLTACGAPPE